MRADSRATGVVLATLACIGVGARQSLPPYQGEAPERYLADATITQVTELGEGITRPMRVELELDGQTHQAVFKAIDVRRQGATTLEDGTVEVGFRDTWETEIAAYQLDLMLGLKMVPATIERRVERDVGSLQWWVESMMSEGDRVAQGLQPPDREAWNQVMFKVRLFDELIANTDRHPRNLLVTADFDARLIDHSRSFRENRDLRAPDGLMRFSRALLDSLATLDRESLKDRVGRYLSNGQIDRLLDRRDDILALAKQRVAELGEAAVIYE